MAQQTETRKVDSFTAVNVSGSMQTTVERGPQRVTITAKADVLERIETYVKKGELFITVKNGRYGQNNWKNTGRIEVSISAPELNGFVYNGSGSLRTTDKFSGDGMDVSLNGSGSMEVDLECRSLTVDQNGSGELTVTGSSDRVRVRKNGSGALTAPRLSANTVEVESNGSGNTRLHAANALSVEANGSGSVYYSGSPRLHVDINGSGRVRQSERN